ncbi:hypothetical protein GCM10027275_53330 [Rhabdobacter roseus]|uniref:Outer membrane lipoprotein-sorting protein n=1 Tax=Rhabdobacter roseus TaxID=1655419 RepID=A0A840TPM7_9BACT|nr:hypothetical protein [Rhabdobacter roseus]MBB5286276.1 outer membrane lipoprotein-sorting protein [Rhabdobacter roseus]
MKTKNILTLAALMSALTTGLALEATAQVSSETSAESPVAKATSDLHVLQMKPMQFRVSYTNPKTNRLSVRIVDAEQRVLFSENKNVSTNYLKYFDLSPLLDGTYTFEITDGNEKYSQSFDIMTQTRRIVAAKN